jgi:multidrug efflux system membrane fusion protein
MMKSPLLFVVLAALLAACNSKESAPSIKPERPALTRIVGVLAANGSRLYSGEIRARHELNLGFRVAGKITERLVDAGAQVKAGQVLARLDPVDAGLQAGAALAQFNLTEADVKRYRELRGKGFVSQSALDAKEAALTAAAAQAGLTRNQSDYAVLRAEHDGVVAAAMAEVGQVVSIGQPVLRIALAGEREVAIEIPETELSRRHVGDVAEVLTGSVTFAGRLRELSPIADSGSRTYAARVAFSAPAGQIALGMTAQVRFETGQAGPQKLLIPLSAVYQQGARTAVWIVAADHSVSLRQVEIAAYRDDGAVIAKGLAAGERIVSAGVHRLSPGEKIRFTDTLGSAQ